MRLLEALFTTPSRTEMLNRSLFWKLFLLCFFLVFSAALSQHIFLRFLSSSQALRHLYLQDWQQQEMQNQLRQELQHKPFNQLPQQSIADAFIPYVQESGYVIDYQDLPYLTLTIDTLAVVDTHGELLTQLGKAEYQPGNLFTQMTLHGREDLVEALIGKDSFGTSTLSDYTGVVVAISLFDTKGEIIGALVSHQRRQLAPGYNGIWYGLKTISRGMVLAQRDFVMNLLLASVIFALVTTLYLRRRVNKLTTSVKQWKKENFEAVIQDHSEDELGQCATELNQMSVALQRALLQTQQNAEYKARLQLAGQLHDTVKQRLFAVNLNLGMLEKLATVDGKQEESTRAVADNIGQQCQLAYRELEQVISALSPQQDIVFEQLPSYLSNKTSKSTLHVQCEIDAALLPQLVPPLALRLISEALQNTQKHSKANSSKVAINDQEHALLIEITDNGRATKVKQHKSAGQGLALIQQAIMDTGGHLSINPNGDSGFTLIAQIIKANTENATP